MNIIKYIRCAQELYKITQQNNVGKQSLITILHNSNNVILETENCYR